MKTRHISREEQLGFNRTINESEIKCPAICCDSHFVDYE